MSRIRCFWIESTEQVENSLRRFTFISDHSCASGSPGHDARVVIGRGPVSALPKLHEAKPVYGDIWPHDDPRWPVACACGYVFRSDDQWQFNSTRLYRRADTGELFTLAAAPIGAMWDAHWMLEGQKQRVYRGPGSWVGPDGLTLVVRTPGGDWPVDGPAQGGGGWTREGKVPDITARPAINLPGVGGGPERYRGFLTAGWLE